VTQLLAIVAITAYLASKNIYALYSTYIEIALASCLLLRFAQAAQNARASDPAGKSGHRFLIRTARHFFPSWVQRGMRFERHVYEGALRAIFKRPLPWLNFHSADGFTFVRGGNYGIVAFALIMVCIVDVPLGGLLLKVIGTPAQLIRYLLYFHLFFFSYLMIWLISDRYHLKQSAHHFKDGELSIQLGFRVSGKIPLSDIDHITVLKNGQTVSDVLPKGLRATKISPFEPANVIVQLKNTNKISLNIMGFSIQPKLLLTLYVDEPQRFADALSDFASKQNSD
jgi:hypothetical protein